RQEYIKLENLLANCSKPCVMDVKMGVRLYDDEADAAKIEKMKKLAESTTSSVIGFRIAGIKYFRDNQYHVLDKSFGKSLTPGNISTGLGTFFDGIPCRKLSLVMDKVINRLEHIKHVVQVKKPRLYSTSLLFYYDFDDPIEANVNLIDFAHSYANKNDYESDDGFIFGIDNLIESLKILQSFK
ncbi:SAICAR synthase-like protein, partial [Rozella allomycis CSF55]